MTRTGLRVALVCATVLTANVHASAFSDEVNRCRGAVVKETTRYVAKLVALQTGCHDARVQGKIPALTDCNDLPAAAAALGKVLPLQALAEDPGAPGGKCETLIPAEVFYTSCPVPCDSTVVSDWGSVNQCLTCLATERIEAFGTTALGSANLPVGEEEELCARSLYAVAARVLPSVLRDSEKCSRKFKDPNKCTDRRSHPGKTFKVRRTTSTRVSANCKGVDFAAVGTCATGLADAACLLTAALNTGEQLAYDAARLQERMLPLSMSPFETLSVGNEMACGLRVDGTLDCWNKDGGIGQFGRRGRFVKVSSSSGGTCGIRPDGSLDCFWNLGFTSETDFSPPVGEFADVAVGSSHACALDSLGAATCWGTSGQADVPGGTFVEISAGHGHTCGRRGDGTLECWGSNLHGQASPPPGVFTQVSAGDSLTCGLRNDGSAECWGNNDYGMTTVPPGPFLRLSDRVSYLYFNCGIRPDSTVECWGEDGLGDVPSPSGTFVEISSNARESCGLRGDGSAACWGSGHAGPFAPPEGGRQQISQGTDGSQGFGYACDLRLDGTIACHGGYEFGEAVAPGGTFVQVSAGDRFACSLRGDGTVDCWGKDDFGQATDPVGTFSQIEAGTRHACGLRTDGTLHCWGDDSLDQSSPPPGIFAQVSGGDTNSCALDADGEGLCWGSDLYGQSPSPLQANFDSIAAGVVSSCGVRTDGKIQCWGRQGSVQPTLTFSRGEFSQTSSECGLRTDGSLDCWIPVWTPAGVFSQVDASGSFCALRDDGYKVCW